MQARQYSSESLKILRDLQIQGDEDNPYERRAESITDKDFSPWLAPYPISDDDRRQIARALEAQLSEISSRLPTKYEDVVPYSIFGSVLDRILDVAKLNELPLPASICHGTVNSLDLNAVVTSVRDNHDEVLIVFKRALVPFCLQLSGFMAACFTPEDDHEGLLELDLRSREPTAEEVSFLYEILADAIRRQERRYDNDGGLRLVLFDRLTVRRPIPLSMRARQVREILLEAVEGFLVGHEVGHAILLKAGAKEAYQEAGSKLTRIQDLYSDEHACDYFGQLLGVQATILRFIDLPRPFIYTLGLMAGPLFLTWLRLVEMASHLVRTGEPLPEVVPNISESSIPKTWHPPTFLRIDQLLIEIRSKIDPLLNKAQVLKPLDAYDWADRFLRSCWIQVEPAFRANYLEIDRYDRTHN